ncbi:hypothetical protein B0T17DRAFT_167495 [Bombardia bombarda]|uniref:Secreted protein n=1 Tax=Bombardia bombarda TaxID=252184 RepID=A0AA39X807_9PEZI|nr:hypothetical protein B0T17DRAFT_167495 [Bombardia bombarda]
MTSFRFFFCVLIPSIHSSPNSCIRLILILPLPFSFALSKRTREDARGLSLSRFKSLERPLLHLLSDIEDPRTSHTKLIAPV